MIVCLCEGLSERHIREQVASGARSVREVAEVCGAGTHCGMCRRQVHGIIEQSRAECGSQNGVDVAGATAAA